MAVTYATLLIAFAIVTIAITKTYLNKSACYRARNAYLVQRGLQSFPAVRGRLPGNLDVLLSIARRAHDELPGAAFGRLARKYGHTFDLRPLGSSMFYTQDPQVVRHILVQNPNNFVKGRFLNDLFSDVLGTGIFNSDGDAWKLHRSSARPFFLKENLQDFTVYERHTEKLIQIIRDGASTRPGSRNAVVEFHDLAQRFTLDAASEFLFGESVDTLGAFQPDRIDPPYLSAFARVQNRLAARLKAGTFWRTFEKKDAMASDMRIVTGLVDTAITNAQSRALEKGDSEEALPGTLLDLINSSGNYHTLKAKRDELMNVMMAARDTTASLIASLLYELARHPDVQVALRQEVLDSLGEETHLSFPDIKGMKLLKAVINETLRLYPPISANSRVSQEDDVIESDGQRYHLPAGTHIAWGIFQLQRRIDLWGKNAADWDPTRWLVGKEHPSSPNFQAWGMGARICIGQELAYLETSFLVSRLIQEFHQIRFARELQPSNSWVPGKEGRDIMPQAPVVTLTLRGGVWLEFCSE